jgi:glycosyltransferase involved in cell wall biosynthesis
MYIINLYPVAAGGGLQNAFSFLSFLKKDTRKSNSVCFVRKNSELEAYCKKFDLKYYSFNDGFIGRCLFELYSARKVCKIIKAECIFTLFSNPPFVFPEIITVSGFARSNVIEQDRDFWNFLPILKRFKTKFFEFVNLKLVSKSDVVIVETKHLLQKAISNNVFGKSLVKLVEMAPSNLIVKKLASMTPRSISSESVINFLYLSGPNPNKNIDKLALMFFMLNRKSKTKKFVLHVTLAESEYLNKVLQSFKKTGAIEYIVNHGAIGQSEIDKVIFEAHALINVARLESFSNNWVEAWASKRLLVCADAQYAHASCGCAAIYIDINDASTSVESLFDVFDSDEKYLDLISEGNKHLECLPSAEDKYFKYWSIIENLK